jgi:hypothetical protein
LEYNSGVSTSHKSTKVTITLAETFGLIVVALLKIGRAHV